MGLYDIVLGDGLQQERGMVYLGLLGFPPVARFRDAWVETSDGGPVIAIYTRQGGTNRAGSCAESNRLLAAHPLYVRDRDDTFDSTYCTFWFRVPAEAREALAGVAVEPADMSARWREAIARVERGELRPSERAAMDQLAAGLLDDSGGGPKVIRI